MIRFRIHARAVPVLAAVLLAAQTAYAQPPGNGNGPPRMPMTMTPDPRTEQRSYHFEDTDEELSYVLFVSSKVSADQKNPLIVALHGLGGDANFLVRDSLVDFAEEGGYVVVGPLGYNVSGWYGSPLIARGNQPVDPPNLSELSEKDVMNVLAIARAEFNIDPDRTYLMGHSMGGAGTLYLGQKYTADWAAIAAIAPAAFMLEPNREQILKPLKDAGIPVIITQGDADTAVPVANTRNWAAALEAMGLVHEYVEIPGGDHGPFVESMPHIFRFFEAHTKAR